MFTDLLVLGLRSGTIYRIALSDRTVDTFYGAAGPQPDGIVVADGVVYWTTMGTPEVHGTTEADIDFSARNGGVHAVGIDGTYARDVIPVGSITTGKQIVSDGAGVLYWGDREGCRVSRVRVDGTGLADLVVNTRDDSWTQECVGVAVDPVHGHLYWTQKGPSDGGRGRILRAPLEIPAGESAARRSDIDVLWDHLPEPIDLEITGNTLYWTDRGNPPDGNTLNRAPLPAPGSAGATPEILAGGFREAIGLAVDADAGTAYVSDIGGQVSAVPLGGGDRTVIADLDEPLSGLAGITAKE